MNKYKSLVYRELKLSAKHYALRTIMFLGFTAMFVLVMFVLKPQAANEGCGLDGFALIGAYAVGILGAFLIGEDNGVYKADVNAGWLTYSWALPLTAFEKAMAKYISKVIVIIAGSVLTILGTALVYAVGGCVLSAKTILSLFIFIDAMLVFYIVLEAFTMRATDPKALKKMGTIAGAVIAALFFLPDILPMGQSDSAEDIISEEAMQSVAAVNELFCKLDIPEILVYISIPLMAIILVVGFIITMKNYERREA